jgi:hypothetical protein
MIASLAIGSSQEMEEESLAECSLARTWRPMNWRHESMWQKQQLQKIHN